MRGPHERRHRRGYRAVATAAVALLVAGACGGEGSSSVDGDGDGGSDSVEDLGENVVLGPQEREGEPVEGGSVTVGLESETNSYMPSMFAGSQAGYNVAYAIYDPLMTRNGEGDVVPYLAESIEPDDDFTTWTLTLRPDVTFHDGTPLNAEALKTVFDTYLTAPDARTASDVAEVERIEVVDELTATYVLSAPDPAFPGILTQAAGWPFSPTAAAEAGDAFGDQPVGTGPFQFVSWQRDGAFVVERNPDYWQDGLPYLDEITFRPIPDEETRATSLESDDIDAAQSVRLSSFLARVSDIPGVEVAVGLGNGSGNAIFNVEQPPVDDVRIRQALAYAVDQEAIIEVTAGEAAPVSELRTQYFHSGSDYYAEAAAEAWPTHDPERAQELYDDYVNDPERSDGKPVGSPVSITFDVTNVSTLVEQGTAYQGFWEEIGFDVTVEPLEQSVHIEGAITGDYQIKSFRAGSDNDPLFIFKQAFGDPDDYLSNLTNYHTDLVDETIETLRGTDDVETRAAAVEELSVQLAEDLPIYWTGSDLTFIASAEHVHGVASWVLPDGSSGDGAAPGITFWSQVWVDD